MVGGELMAQPVPPEREKYNDKDIQADFARLHTIAATYLLTYCGTFQPMRDAKAVIKAGEILTVHQLRVVCNTMLYDFGVRNMPEPQGHLFTFDAAAVEVPNGGATVTQLGPRRVGRKRGVERPIILDLRSGMNKDRPYWYSIRTNAYLVHIGHSVTVRYHTERYYDSRDWYVIAPAFHERFELGAKALCKSWHRWPVGLCTASPQEAVELVATNKRWCRICVEEAEQNGWVAPE
jgi:hypothetical protein